MTDNDKEIVQTLKNHIEAEDCVTCESFEKCDEFLLTKNTLDLINRQQAEIERLKIENMSLQRAASSLKSALREEQYCTNNAQKQINSARFEAVREFAERLISIGKQDGAYDYVSLWDIDNLVKEMVSENNNE